MGDRREDRRINRPDKLMEITDGDLIGIPVTVRRYPPSQLLPLIRKENLIMSGGQGDIYSFRDASTNERLAVKRTEKNRAAAIKEALEMANFAHERIMPVRGICDQKDLKQTFFLVMPLMRGDLSSRYQQLSLRKIVQVLKDCADALCHIHRGREVNGVPVPYAYVDFKPFNVLLDNDDRAFLSDFGTVAPQGSMALAWTPAYASPEYYMGYDFRSNSYTAEVRLESDVYSFGTVLFELVSQKPYSDDLSHSLCDDAIFRPEEFIATRFGCYDITKRLLTLGIGCTATKPEERPRMDRVALVLRGILNDL